MSKKFVVIGSSAVDIFAISKFFDSQNSENISQISFEHGSQIWTDNTLHEPGGNGLLAAITIARQSNEVSMYTKLSSDLFGKALESVAKAEKIKLCGDYISAKHHTDTTIHLSVNGKDQTSLIYNGSFLDFSKKSVSSLNSQTDFLHLANLCSDKSTLSKLVKWCAKNNVKLSANFQYLNTFPARVILKFLRQCSVVVLNHDEACMLVGGYCAAPLAAQKLFEDGINHIVIYGEKAESVVCCNGEIISAKLRIKSNSLEYTGVEAVFAAAYVEEYYKSVDTKKALSRAVTQAASVMTIAGARAGILHNPVRKEMKIGTHKLETEEI